ncbi:MAG: TIM-barrel domain-containing protein [Flavobacteriaceae bacterium]
MKNSLSLIWCLFTCCFVFAEQSLERNFLKAQFKDNILKVSVTDGTYRFAVFSDEIIETSFLPHGENYTSQSHALNNPIPQNATYSEDKASISLSTAGIGLVINKAPFKISYNFRKEFLIEERIGYSKDETHEKLHFTISDDEVLYGGGARALGMNRRGYKLELYNKAHYGYETHSELMNFTMPVVMSSKKYALHFDNTAIGYLDLDSNKDNSITYATVSGRKTYQVIAAASWAELTEAYTDLTGRQPIPPRWALGNFASRFGYHSQREVEQLVKDYETNAIPLDAVILDLYWFGKTITGTMGNLEVDHDSFPNFEKMVADLNQKGIKTITITEPFILKTSSKWDEAVKNDVLAKTQDGEPYTYDFYFGHTGLIDIYSGSGRDWFWSIYKGLHDKGIMGVWGDLGEPEVHPDDLVHAKGSAQALHNIYGHDWARMIYEGYKKDYPNERPFILMRAGYSGSQRFGMIPWSGDVNRTWGGLQSQPEIALQMGMQGMAYMHSDLGGFAGANLDDELYVRWLQYGVFQPIFRPHAQEEVPSEPVYRSDEAKELSKKAIELRYKLLPYNYDLSYKNHISGIPMMRPLFFSDNTPVLNTYCDSYLWGDAFLVSPVMISQNTSQEVYFPSGDWYDFYNGTIYSGGGSQMVDTSKDYIPTFVKAGSFVPMAKHLKTTNDYDGNAFELHYYLSLDKKDSSYSMYNDDGLTAESINKGMYEILNFEVKYYDKEMTIKMTAENGLNFKTNTKSIDFVFHHLQDNINSVLLNGNSIPYKFNNETSKLSIPLNWDTSQTIKITIKT